MAQQLQGSFRLLRVAGIDVFLHWTWFLLAAYEIGYRSRNYTSLGWNALEYVSVFGIVLLHEFGHALACRSVGGEANTIVLWPLGGIAYVSPPPRPGALLWSIAAGPLVNFVLVPFTLLLWWLARGMQVPDFTHYCWALLLINAGLLIFNLLPIYPLDGGQVLHALLWFILGRWRSLLVASVIGLVVGVLVIIPFVLWEQWWLSLIAVFIVLRSWAAIQRARVLAKLDQLPRHADRACPFCGAAPPQGAFAGCPQCGTAFDVFEQQGVCPNCHARVTEVDCLNCGRRQPLADWVPAVVPAPPAEERGFA